MPVSRAVRLVGLIVFGAFLIGFAPPPAAEVRWKSGRAGATRVMPQNALRQELTRLAARSGKSRVVVRLRGPVDAASRARLADSGVRLLGYLGDSSYFASLDKGLDAERVIASRDLLRVEPIATEDKLHPDLARGVVHDWARIPGVNPRKDGSVTVAVYVLFHPDFDASRFARKLLARHRARIQSRMPSINGVVAHLPSNRIRALAAEDAVMYVEPPLPALSPINDSNRARIGADTLQVAPYGLDGSGITVLVYDAGQMFAHADFGSRLTVGATDTSGISDHATHVGGTIGGDGSSSGGQYRGMAPGVDLISYGFEQEGGLQQGFLYTDPGDLEDDYTAAINAHGADLSNNSIGTNTASNGFPCDWEGNYGATGALIDAIVGGSLGAPFRVVWANGNERSSGACGTTYLTTAPPACAKNHITVGALDSNDDAVTSFTSWGPCDDGRLKPDISGPGCQGDDDFGVTSTSSSGGYNVKCGTSMASPSVAGVAALLLEQYRASFPGQPDPRNATLKAILANSAADIDAVGPDYKSGYGSVRAVDAADTIIEERFLEAQVAQGEVYSFIIVVDPADTELRVTLAWDDAPGTPNVNPVLVNDLDLRVIDTSSTTHYPWTLDPANPADPAVRTQRDGVNNIEQVVIDAPAPGAYRVEVAGFNVAAGPTQVFGVAASPSLVNCAPAGNLSTDRARAMCQASLGIQVIDCDLNTDDATVETAGVTVVSGSEPGGESVTLTETAAPSAAFAGTVSLDTTDAAGVLQVSDGETVTVTYIDADDGAGGVNVQVTRDVIVDCTAPSITGVAVTEINPRDATATIDVDEPTGVTLHYGTTCGAPTDSATSLSLQTQHAVKMAGLTDETTYYFTVEAQDEAGNLSTDDNGGSCYTFTTPQVPDFLTEQFTAGIDLVGSVVTFTPNGSVDFYETCVGALTGGLRTDPGGGTALPLSDDQPLSFTLAGGDMVSLYGQSYDTIFVGPNGYLTFGSGDSTYNEDFAAHFSLPRVAALFDDLNPSVGGAVSWKQLADRVAVSWENVPEYSTSNSNTFQIEMFFDGRIRLGWLNLEGSDAIVGLSEGNGVDPDFLASDLSVGATCPAEPPVASNLAAQTNEGLAISLGLMASDDGLPTPPALTYRIVRLPDFGTLTDEGSSTTISSVPYDLSAGGSQVTYTPQAGVHGWDSFDYLADDGGTAPAGGLSNVAVVGVTIGSEVVAQEFLVDDTDPGWSVTGDWAFGPPTGGGTHAGDPTGGATGSNVYGYNLGGDYANNMGTEFLTTQPIDLSGNQQTEIEFRRWLGVESSTYDHADLEISVDGSTWSTVWSHSGSAIDESSWSVQRYDVSAVADGQSTVSFRWIMGTTDGSVTYPGWNIDDVRILGTQPPVCSAPPGEPPNVRIGADGETLMWDAAAYTGGSAPVYDVLRSTDPADFAAPANTTCVESDDGADRQATDTAVAPPGVVFYYLVRAETPCGAGSLGQGAAGTRSGLACVAP